MISSISLLSYFTIMRSHLKSQSFLAVLLLCYTACSAQTYQDVLPDWNINVSFAIGEYGGGVSLVDWNGDGLDDMSVCQNGSDPKFFQNVSGVLVEVEPFFSNDDELKQMNWVDFDNDGDKDLSVTTYLQPTRLFRNDGGDLNEITATSGIASTNHLTFGHSWGDYDRDGLLDLYICHYHYFESIPNQCYHNLGDGTFEEVASQIGISDFANHSFQGVWLDYNQDGWQDLFVINDRIPSSNHLYRNDGGTFTDVTLEANVEAFIFSMSNTVGDYDNDGDFDIFVSNNPSGHLLHQQQDDGTFLEVADAAGVATYDMGWAAQWIDYDLDGWQDLHVNCSPFWLEQGQNKFYRNNQDGTFIFDLSMGFDNDLAWSHSSAVGDVNNDGTFDIAVVNEFPDTSSLWLSSPGTNNYLKVGLEGVVSNRDGVGSKILCFANDLTQMRYTYCGEGYMSQNSTVEIFGIGEADIVDSLEITWLSGHVDIFYNIDVNQKRTFIEGSSMSIDLAASNSPYFCPGDTLSIAAPSGYSSYLWSTGDTSQITLSHIAEMLTVTATNEFGLVVVSEQFETNIVAPLQIIWNGIGPTCYAGMDGEIELDITLQEAEGLIWLNGSEGSSLDSLPAGQYSFLLTDSLGCLFEGLIELFEPEELLLNFNVMHVSCFGVEDGSIALEPSGGTGQIEIDWNGIDPSELGVGEYLVSVSDSMACSAQELIAIDEPDELVVEIIVFDADGFDLGSAQLDISGGTEPYDISWSNDDNGLNTDELDQGEYSALVVDENDCEVSVEFSIVNVGIDEANKTFFKIYPNPKIDGKVQIDSNSPMSELKIYSNLGITIFEENLGNVFRYISTVHLASGNYVFEIRYDDGSYSRSSVSVLSE
ncbi:MAG: hypothetical protein ACI9RU_001120 [Litorivivens sp.]|jgi:hypothetical protein